jgi:glutathione synthase/RimK-type ligase-like ATP-grasp enzyme
VPQVLTAGCRALPAGDEDQPRLASALAERGIDVAHFAWDDEAAPWGDADLVVIRSCWDYTEHREAFLSWARGIERLENPVGVLEWSSDKRYLAQLAGLGIPTIETRYVTDPADLVVPAAGRFVVKPSVGAGSNGARRFERHELGEARAHAEQLLAAASTALVQPYLEAVEQRGETDLILLDGGLSHAVEKGPMLLGGTRHETRLFSEERIRPRTPSEEEAALALEALAAPMRICDLERAPCYARVDLLDGEEGPVLLELELIEPSLFLAHHPAAAPRLAAAIASRLGMTG